MVLQSLWVPGATTHARRQNHDDSGWLVGYSPAYHSDRSYLLDIESAVGMSERRVANPRRVSRIMVEPEHI